MSETLEVLALAGSLRRASFNRRLVHSAAELAPSGMSVEIFDLAGIPLFDQDVEDEGDPDAVGRLKGAIRGADALFIATPEYNLSIPGVLKNAVDWASRPPGRSALQGKPVAIAGATPGRGGTARAQDALRHTLRATGALVLPRPDLLLASAGDLFDERMLTDEGSRRRLRRLLEALADWSRTLAGGD